MSGNESVLKPGMDGIDSLLSVTIYLDDALPVKQLSALDEELRGLPETVAERSMRVRLDRLLDAGNGSCLLKNRLLAGALLHALWHGADGVVANIAADDIENEGEKQTAPDTDQTGIAALNGGHPLSRYRLFAWCIMPNHLHILLRPNVPIDRIVKSWQSCGNRWVSLNNQQLEPGVTSDKLWGDQFWERVIKDQIQLDAATLFIENNPVKAGLCKKADEWYFSSARLRKHNQV